MVARSSESDGIGATGTFPPRSFFSYQLDVGPFAKYLVENWCLECIDQICRICFQIRKRGGSGLRRSLTPR